MTKTVSQAKANKILAAINNKYGSLFGDEPGQFKKIDQPFIGKDPRGQVAIIWEAGPYEWAVEESSKIKVPGTFLEPYSSFMLTIYPEDN